MKCNAIETFKTLPEYANLHNAASVPFAHTLSDTDQASEIMPAQKFYAIYAEKQEQNIYPIKHNF